MKLSIIIINYNTFEMTCNCLRDIYSNTWNFAFEIILVDNASVECDPEKFKELFPLIILIKSPDNGGFSRGNNLGIAVAKGKYLLILNSDTLNLDNGIKQCVAYMDAHRHEHDLGGVGCKVLSPDGSMQRSAFNYRTRAHSALLNNSVFSYAATKLGWSKYRDDQYVTAMHQQEHAVQAMLGAFMLIRRDVVAKARPFEPDFFMYCEEIEWCYRINDNGFRLMYLPDAHITHIGGGSSSLVTKKEINNKQFYLSILMLVFKQDGYSGLLLFNLLFGLNLVTNMALLPFRSAEIREGHKSLLRGTWYSLRRQGILLKYFKPTFASSKFPFKTATVDELAATKRV